MIGIRDLNRIITNIDYLVRGIPSRLRSVLRYARNYPAEKRSITSLQTELVADVKEIQRLIKAGAPEFKLVFIKLENAKRIALTLMDYIVALREVMLASRDSNANRMPSLTVRTSKVLEKLFQIQLEAESNALKESDNGVRIDLLGNVCIYQLCFKNSMVAIIDKQCIGDDCYGNSTNKDVIIKVKSRKTTQLGVFSGMRIPEGSTTEIRLSRQAGVAAKSEGDLKIVIPCLISPSCFLFTPRAWPPSSSSSSSEKSSSSTSSGLKSSSSSSSSYDL